jgi:hypothetical protein
MKMKVKTPCIVLPSFQALPILWKLTRNFHDDRWSVLWFTFSPLTMFTELTERYDAVACFHCPLASVWRTDDNNRRTDEQVESIRPPEILCRILQLAVGSDGVKTLLPFTHVSTRWRGAALGDSSLWTTTYLQQTTTPLVDMTLL